MPGLTEDFFNPPVLSETSTNPLKRPEHVFPPLHLRQFRPIWSTRNRGPTRTSSVVPSRSVRLEAPFLAHLLDILDKPDPRAIVHIDVPASCLNPVLC